jgi:hypothetical protein
MLDSLKPARTGKRWPRGQKFVLTNSGTEAEGAYREAVHTARAQGRAALDLAQRGWAAPLRLEPGDGVVLSEIRPGRRSIAEVAKGLDDCGTSLAEVKASVDRLAEAGLIEPAPTTTSATL